MCAKMYLKITFQCLLMLWICSISCESRVLKIGGLFDHTSNDQELAFQYAVEAVNRKINLKYHHLSAEYEIVSMNNTYDVYMKLCSLLKRGVAAIFGPSSQDTSHYVRSTCDSLEVPQLEMLSDSYPTTSTSVINLYPYPPTISQVYVDMVHAYKWKSFTILYENDFGMQRISELLKMYDSKGHTVTLRRLDILNGNNYRPILNLVKKSKDHNIILECSVDHLYEILKQLQQVGLMSDHHNYIITSLDMHTIDLEPFQHGGANITGFRLVDPEDPDVISAYKLWTEKRMIKNSMRPKHILVETALMYDAVHVFALALKELNISLNIANKALSCDSTATWEHGYSLVNYMKSITHKGLTGVIKFDNRGFRSDFQLDVVELTMNEGLIKIGVWNSTEGFNKTKKVELVNPNSDELALQNRTFIVLISISKPYGMLKESPIKLTGNDRYEGFGIDLIQEMAQMCGFNYTFIDFGSNYGSFNKTTNEWSGMIREIRDGRAHLAVTDLTITSEREDGVDFTSPFMNLGISILYKKAQKIPPELFSFMDPFSSEVWFFLGMAYLGVSLLLFIMGRISPYEWTNPFPCIEEPELLFNQFTLRNSLWFTVGSLLQQGSEIAPIAMSTRLVAGNWWFFTLIMVSSYTANLAAFLTVESTFSPIKDVEDLAGQTSIKYGAKKGGSTAGFFRDSNNTMFKKMGEFMAKHPDGMPTENEIGVNLVKTTNYAYFMESTSIEYIVERECDLTRVGRLLDDKGYGVAMKKDSPYRNALSTAVLKLQESGKLTEMKIKWWKEQRGGGACGGSETSGEAAELGVPNVGGVFLVMAVGVFCSMAVSFIEMILDIWSRSHTYHIPFRELFIEEVLFFVKFSGLTKPVRTSSKEVIDEDISRKSDEEGRDPVYSGFSRYGFNVDLKKSSVD